MATFGALGGLQLLLTEFSSRSRTARLQVLGGPTLFLRAGRGNADARAVHQVWVQRQYSAWRGASQPQVILDLGAHIGAASLWFRKEYPTARIVAVEPDPANYHYLAKNVACFEIETVNKAVWSETGVLTLRRSPRGGWASSVHESAEEAASQNETEVQAISIPDLLAELKIQAVDLLKVDIEGAESRLFGGDCQWLHSVRVMVIELHDHFVPGCGQSVFGAVQGRMSQLRNVGETTVFQAEPAWRSS